MRKMRHITNSQNVVTLNNRVIIRPRATGVQGRGAGAITVRREKWRMRRWQDHPRDLGDTPPGEVLRGLQIRTMEEKSPAENSTPEGGNPFSALIPWLTGISGGVSQSEKTEPKPSRYLVAKGLPTLPMKLVEKVWNLEYVDMEEFLPAPRSRD